MSNLFVRLYTIQGTEQISNHMLNDTELRTQFIHIPKKAKKLRLIQSISYLTHSSIAYKDTIVDVSDIVVGARFDDSSTNRVAEVELIVHGENQEYISMYTAFTSSGNSTNIYDNTIIIEVQF